MDQLKDIELQLSKSSTPFLQSSDKPSDLDAQAFQIVSKVLDQQSPKEFPFTFAWFTYISQFSENARNGWVKQ